VRSVNTDISAHRFESRGLLHAGDRPKSGKSVLACVRISFVRQRRRAQTEAMTDYVRQNIPMVRR